MLKTNIKKINCKDINLKNKLLKKRINIKEQQTIIINECYYYSSDLMLKDVYDIENHSITTEDLYYAIFVSSDIECIIDNKILKLINFIDGYTSFELDNEKNNITFNYDEKTITINCNNRTYTIEKNNVKKSGTFYVTYVKLYYFLINNILPLYYLFDNIKCVINNTDINSDYLFKLNNYTFNHKYLCKYGLFQVSIISLDNSYTSYGILYHKKITGINGFKYFNYFYSYGFNNTYGAFNYYSIIDNNYDIFNFVIFNMKETYGNIISGFDNIPLNFSPTYYNEDYKLEDSNNLTDNLLLPLNFTAKQLKKYLENGDVIWFKDYKSTLFFRFTCANTDEINKYEILINTMNPRESVRILTQTEELTKCQLYNNTDLLIFKYKDNNDYIIELIYNCKTNKFTMSCGSAYQEGDVTTELLLEENFTFIPVYIQLHDDVDNIDYYTEENIKRVFNGYPEYITNDFKNQLNNKGINITSKVVDQITINNLNMFNELRIKYPKFILRAFTKLNIMEDYICTKTNTYNQFEYIKYSEGRINKSFNFYDIGLNLMENCNYITLIAWNEEEKSIQPIDPSETKLTFAIDANRKLYKFNNGVNRSQIKNLVSNYDNPIESNNN